MCSNCKADFNTTEAYILNATACQTCETDKITIKDYISQPQLVAAVKAKLKFLVCKRGHKLIHYESTKKRHHFQHINRDDIGMSEWHSEWQSNFAIGKREIQFKKIGLQLKTRYADVCIFNKSIEFQHSQISYKDVKRRKQDHLLHGHKIYWVIDSKDSNNNDTIIEHTLPASGRIYLEFKKDYWKYEHFKSHSFIFLNIGDRIYRINPHKVKSHMIDVCAPLTKYTFIDMLKRNTPIPIESPLTQSSIYINQRGAGNGKTYGIIQLLNTERHRDKKCFIMVTKQHSAKDVIKREWEKHESEGLLPNIELIHEFSDPSNKKFTFEYRDIRMGGTKQLIIATIDSFVWNIGNKQHTNKDQFTGIINSIINGYSAGIHKNGKINYSNTELKLNKELMFILDETQDLPEIYLKALHRIQRDRYIDLFCVGDQLQSISYKKNSFTLLSDGLPNTTLIPTDSHNTNICRRFGDSHSLVHLVNNIIKFKDYHLPEISYERCTTLSGLTNSPVSESFEIFQGLDMRRENDHAKINSEIQKFITRIAREIRDHDYTPEDFLIITPFTKRNSFGDSLELAIQEFWVDTFSDEAYRTRVLAKHAYWKNKIMDNKYSTYCKFHKSQEGTSIDTKQSEHATRMVSIHSSKGDGRPVVFVFGLTEAGLKLFSENERNIIYESLLHVAVTRMKTQLYVSLIMNNDDIHQRFANYQGAHIKIDTTARPNILTIRNRLMLSHLKGGLDSDKNYTALYENLIIEADNPCPDEKRSVSKTIDMEHHLARYCIVKLYLQLFAISKAPYDPTSQLFMILKKVSTSTIYEADNFKDFNRILSGSSFKEYIPICKLTAKGAEYLHFFNIIKETCLNLKKRLRKFIKRCSEDYYYNNTRVLNVCPYECIILHYMCDVYKNRRYGSITMMNIYEVTNHFHNTSGLISDEHCHCNCGNYFSLQTTIQSDDNESKIISHYNSIKKIYGIYKNFKTLYPDCKWLIDHYIGYQGGTEEYTLGTNSDFVVYNEDNIILCSIKPQLNSMNYNAVMTDSIYKTWLVQSSEYINKTQKISSHNKKITTCIFTLDYDEPKYISWHDQNLITNHNAMLGDIIQNSMSILFKKHNATFMRFIKWCIRSADNGGLGAFINTTLHTYSKREAIPKYILDRIVEINLDEERGRNIQRDWIDDGYLASRLVSKMQASLKAFIHIV